MTIHLPSLAEIEAAAAETLDIVIPPQARVALAAKIGKLIGHPHHPKLTITYRLTDPEPGNAADVQTLANLVRQTAANMLEPDAISSSTHQNGVVEGTICMETSTPELTIETLREALSGKGLTLIFELDNPNILPFAHPLETIANPATTEASSRPPAASSYDLPPAIKVWGGHVLD